MRVRVVNIQASFKLSGIVHSKFNPGNHFFEVKSWFIYAIQSLIHVVSGNRLAVYYFLLFEFF